MRIVKGERYKSIKMAELFRADHGDLLVDYDGGVHWDDSIPKESAIWKLNPKNISLDTLLEGLVPFIVTHNPFVLFIYGIRSDEHIETIQEWAKNFPTLRLTVSQQTEGNLEVVEV